MKNFLFGALRLGLGIIYFVLVFCALMALDHKIGGFTPTYMANDLRWAAKLTLIELSLSARQPGLKNPYDFRENNFGSRPETIYKAVVGINPKCFPGVPTNTIDVLWYPEKYPDYKPQFRYTVPPPTEQGAANQYAEFFNNLPCPKANEVTLYGAIVGARYNGMWSYYFKNDAGKNLIAIDKAGQPIKGPGNYFWFGGLLFLVAGCWANRQLFKSRNMKFIEAPNYLLLVALTFTLVSAISNWPYWVLLP